MDKPWWLTYQPLSFIRPMRLRGAQWQKRPRCLTALGYAIAIAGSISSTAIAQSLPLTPKPNDTLPSPVADRGTPPAADLQGRTLTVGIKPILPFVFVEDTDAPYGYSIDLWNAIAERLGVTTEFQVFETVPDLLDAARSGQVDVAIAGISITQEREASGLDFSYPIYQAGLQIVALDRSRFPIARYVGYLTSPGTLLAIARVFLGALVVGTVLWLIERKHNPTFQHGFIPGVGQGIWFAIVTLGTFGYGDVTPTRPWSRVVAVIWMGASFFILADFIASISAAYQANTPIRRLEDVYNQPVVAITGSTAADFLRSKPVQLKEQDTYEGLFSVLEQQNAIAAVIDYPTARYESLRHPKLLLAGNRLNREDYGIAVQEGQEILLEAINQELLGLQKTGMFEMLDKKWFNGQ